MRIAILGGGVAAFEAANAARKFSAEVETDIYSSEALPPYRRPALSGMLANFTINEKMFFIKPESFYAENNIGLHLNKSCMEIKENCLLFADGSQADFDKLIIATGGAARRPPIPGSDLPNVCTFRSFADLEKLNTAVAGIKSAVVIGGGVLGLELAESLLKRNIHVTVLEMNQQLFADKLTPEAAAEVEAKLREVENFDLRLGVKVSAVNVDGVMLENGDEVPGEVVIFSTGSRPVLPEKFPASLKVGRGIIVDRKMQTSCPNIFAAGDAIELEGKCFGLYNDARNTGMVAGANAAGGSEEYLDSAATPVRFFSFGFKLVMP